jgi:hypothetical protein
MHSHSYGTFVPQHQEKPTIHRPDQPQGSKSEDLQGLCADGTIHRRTCLDAPLKVLVEFKESLDGASNITIHGSLTGPSPPETMRRGIVSALSCGRQDEGRPRLISGRF